MEKTMEKIVALAKNRGFVYPGSEIYGGLAKYLGLAAIWVLRLKNNVKKSLVGKKFVQESPIQRRSGLCDSDEFPDMGSQRPSGRIF